MSDTKPTGGPAFPLHVHDVPGIIAGFTENGMTLRDYFAAKAMAGFDARFASLFSFHWASRIAYAHADAMLKSREQ